MDYLIIPFFTWLATGITKFIVNCLSERRLAFDLVGYGGMPSNHSAVVSSITTLVALKEGMDSPAFGVSLAFSFIVLLDANSLRNKIADQAKLINRLLVNTQLNVAPVRERIGHSKLEILAGVILGAVSAGLLFKL